MHAPARQRLGVKVKVVLSSCAGQVVHPWSRTPSPLHVRPWCGAAPRDAALIVFAHVRARTLLGRLCWLVLPAGAQVQARSVRNTGGGLTFLPGGGVCGGWVACFARGGDLVDDDDVSDAGDQRPVEGPEHVGLAGAVGQVCGEVVDAVVEWFHVGVGVGDGVAGVADNRCPLLAEVEVPAGAAVSVGGFAQGAGQMLQVADAFLGPGEDFGVTVLSPILEPAVSMLADESGGATRPGSARPKRSLPGRSTNSGHGRGKRIRPVRPPLRTSPRRGVRSGNRYGPGGRTKAQLYDDAKQAGIPGRSKMSKQQLQDRLERT